MCVWGGGACEVGSGVCGFHGGAGKSCRGDVGGFRVVLSYVSVLESGVTMVMFFAEVHGVR